MMILPNGSGGTMIIPTADLTLESGPYYGTYTTGEGLYVNVTFHTQSQAIADREQTELLEKMGWSLVPASQTVKGLPQKLTEAVGWTLLAAVTTGVLIFCASAALSMGNFITSSTFIKYVSNIVRYGLILTPGIAVLACAVVLAQHSSRKKHD